MKNSLISTSVAVLLASNSIVAFASSVAIPNTFTAGQPAVAADVNANFDAVAVGVNDNDSRVTTNTGAIGTNTTAIGTNTTDIGTNTTDIGTNTTDIGTNTTDIATNAADILALQGSAGCPTEMVAVGSLCVDKWEAAVYDAPTLGTRYGAASDDYLCDDSGSDCGAGAINAIYARSEDGVVPSTDITLYQAAQACANVGKRLPTATEWQMAAAGTPSGQGDGSTGCNSATGNTDLTAQASGLAATCVSSAGAFDMVGNLWEWVSNLDIAAAPTGLITDTDTDTIAWVLGNDFVNSGGGSPNTKQMIILDNSGSLFAGFPAGPNTSAGQIVGFRCVR